MIDKKIIYGIAIILLVAILMVALLPSTGSREEFISMKQDIQGELLSQGKYKCCLEKPCTYCIEKTPGHGEGAECSCLEDVVNGVHPCGECIGEILEGHGNPYLKEYFAEAIAEETGELEAIQRIIDEKYGE
jgi:hypothetical protein